MRESAWQMPNHVVCFKYIMELMEHNRLEDEREMVKSSEKQMLILATMEKITPNVYTVDSGVYLNVLSGLNKMSRSEISSLLSMLIATTDK